MAVDGGGDVGGDNGNGNERNYDHGSSSVVLVFFFTDIFLTVLVSSVACPFHLRATLSLPYWLP